MGYLDRLKKHVSAECAPCVLPKVPKALLAVKTVATGHVFRKQGAKVSPHNTATPFDREWFEERAATLEYDAGFPRQEAERLAMEEVTKWLH
jgi:hypothetical protein